MFLVSGYRLFLSVQKKKEAGGITGAMGGQLEG